jgi:hypothetical protein
MKQPNEVFLRPMERHDRRRLIMPEDEKLRMKCEEFRYAVEHPNERGDVTFSGQVFRHIDPTAWLAFKYDGVVVGYRVIPCSPLEINHYFDRYAYVEIPGYKITELTVKQLTGILTAIRNGFFEPQMGRIHEANSEDNTRILFRQRFQVAFWKENNPNLVTLAGGINTNPEGVIIQ